jgi:type IV pilus assembly protein PilY1
MIYVGSNDGFLHGFNALTGQELFAYVPGAVIPNLSLLSDPNYAHRYYVDGSPAAWDAYFGIGGGSASWRTVLTGTTGAGGKSVFALDVTDPAAFSASKVLWEINQDTPYRSSGTSVDAADPQYSSRLGFSLGQPVVAKLNNGQWAAVFGNGYRSSGEQASLYIVRVSDGTLIKRIDTGVGSVGSPNGLGTPTLYDSDGDELVDAAYAPDMRGNIWKFSLTGNNTANWQIAFGSAAGFPNGQPLFQARSGASTVQPISARIELAKPPAGKPGVMVLFGTGRFFAVGDNTDTTGQSFYGIWDNLSTPVTATDRSTLQVQTITSTTMTLRGQANTPVRRVSGNTVDWTTKRGWYIDLPSSMERVIGAASVRDGRAIFTTVIPSPDPCQFGGSGWLMEVSATTGAKLPYAVFDTNGDKLVNANDDDISGVPTPGMVKRPIALDGAPAAKCMSGTTTEVRCELNLSFGPVLGRESWREVRR